MLRNTISNKDDLNDSMLQYMFWITRSLRMNYMESVPFLVIYSIFDSIRILTFVLATIVSTVVLIRFRYRNLIRNYKKTYISVLILVSVLSGIISLSV